MDGLSNGGGAMKRRVMLHMHQLRDFIDDRYSFHQKYFNNIEPRFYQYKGVQKAFQVGSAVDFAIKQYYLNINAGDDKEKDLFSSREFQTLNSKIDQTLVIGLIGAYIDKYRDEYFHDYKIINFKVPIANRRMKQEYVIYCSPDLVASNFVDNELFIIEIKTSADDPKKYSAETLDFQTMCYCWASWRWNFKIPAGVLKRTLMKPKIKQKKDETVSEFQKRLIFDISDNPDKYFKTGYRPMNKEMVENFEKYLIEILVELDGCLMKKNEHKYYKQSNDYWGL